MMIEISEKAESIINQMVIDSGNDRTFLRVGVEDGGCSGLSYNIKLDDTITNDDHSLQTDHINVVWNTQSEPYLAGVKIDYVEQGMTGGFTIDNPNAKATCGCGASFRTATFKGKREKCDE
ncbi:iron-sulfur cluster assembly accessory protein [Paenibacillus sp. FSL K6-3182]|uniref:HesB/IscA family protein n=1 Tax=Paenibacillus sp. FSL K6-3182 TaxID=2921495 RepID=UPI0030D56383